MALKALSELLAIKKQIVTNNAVNTVLEDYLRSFNSSNTLTDLTDSQEYVFTLVGSALIMSYAEAQLKGIGFVCEKHTKDPTVLYVKTK